MSLLSACQDAAAELGIPAPSSVAAADNPDARLLFRLAKKEGYLLSQRALWQVLRKEHTFTTAASDTQPLAALPADFDCFVEETFFDRSARRPVAGPLTPQAWQEYKATLVVPVDPCFLVRGNRILMAPLPAAGSVMVFEYISTQWALSATGVAKDTFTDDADTTVFRDAIITQGIIWRYRKQKGLVFEDERLDYERMVADRMMRDGGKPRIQTGAVRGAMARGRARMNDYNTIKAG